MPPAPAKSVTLADPPIIHAKYFQVSIPVLTLNVGFFTQVSGFSAQVDVLEYPEGGINDYVHRLPSRIKQGNITLKRGVAKEASLLEWLQQSVVKVKQTDLSIKVLDFEGKPLQTWSFRQAYPVKWTGSDLNAGGSEFLTQSLEVAHSGMQVVQS
jgi:phage tail-like protein